MRQGLSGAVALLLSLAIPPAWGDCIQNPGFDFPSGWQLTQGGPSGVARIAGGFLEVSVLSPLDTAQARQRCTSTAPERQVLVEVDDLGMGTVRFEIGWENEAGTGGEYTLITSAGVASAITTEPGFDHIVFRADGTRIGASAQMLDNVVVIEETTPLLDRIIDYLLTGEPDPPPDHWDQNGDGVVDIADVVDLLN
jgi:hypothetical protein